MPRTALYSAVALAALLVPASAQQCGGSFVEGFEGLSNIGAWGWAPSLFQASLGSGGNPAAWLGSSKLVTPLPILFTQDPISPFGGNWRAASVTSIGVDLFAVDLDPTQCGRPVTIELRSDAGTPGNTLDDLGAVFVTGESIPCKDADWHSYTVAVPTRSKTLPPGWAAWSNGGLSGAQVWNALVQDVGVVLWMLGDPTVQYFTYNWTLGADNPRLGFQGGPGTYCTAQHNSLGCSPALSWIGSPSASAGSFQLTAHQLLHDTPGIWFYGFAPGAAPLLGGTLCVAPPIQRLGLQSTAGGPTGCTGSLGLDVNALVQSGVDPRLVAGAAVYFQSWSRDPGAAQGSSLSNAVQFTICP